MAVRAEPEPAMGSVVVPIGFPFWEYTSSRIVAAITDEIDNADAWTRASSKQRVVADESNLPSGRTDIRAGCRLNWRQSDAAAGTCCQSYEIILTGLNHSTEVDAFPRRTH